jgi:hypothetical protein
MTSLKWRADNEYRLDIVALGAGDIRARRQK